MSGFKWTPKKERAAIMLARGYTEVETASEIGVSDRTIRRWKDDVEFEEEINRLSLMVDIAGRAERLRIAMRAARKFVKENEIITNRDLLDWLKFAQSETDGIKLDLASLAEAAESVADSGSN